MSVSLLLIPAALAAAAAIQARSAGQSGGSGGLVCTVSTRMRDSALLSTALRETGAVVTTGTDLVDAVWQGVTARFTRDTEGIWAAHFAGDVDETRAVEIVRRLDAAYGRQVQAAVLDRLRTQAPAAGLRLASETVTDDASVRLVFAVEQRERA
ncbi:hypothetical protein Ais01nite_15480 [Asanoa ishikariensis]|uniref:Uncharacterized protein n=1 Tax=Asanoa ishikariensis TaxID=137265 RepID=A0A1H3UJF9_9ACTN|nr:hypothetical protein [Asanoa ishikariensis]GIF63513.1 hypothetical protein Ais01nite_15480 [Asanoa ishikariensis]SDZ61849.1 hypothetical protein SAMN05421684_7325 [Asanoa ishikariensis]